ncbi:3-oxoacyl-[acyl-carrier-protein] reductase [Chloroflexales bacterium ZM16-3]|nr:3-oxoacyl-[acyl-carrier-protein] reductase [Chloroflexales bacterium ZM16-3]
MTLHDQVAIVTGASRGIGRAIALDLAQQGARVLVNYRHSAEVAEEMAAQIRQAGGDALAYQADVSDESAVTKMFEATLSRWGRLDILIGNAGVTADAPLMRLKPEQWDHVIQTDLNSIFLCCKAALPAMRSRQYGRIITISSLAGLAGNIGQTNYAAAKAGMIGFTRALAREVAAEGITANVVAPGYIDTDMVETISPALREWALNTIAMHRFGTADEVAAAVSFLATPRASYITGHVLTLDGGWVMP